MPLPQPTSAPLPSPPAGCSLAHCKWYRRIPPPLAFPELCAQIIPGAHPDPDYPDPTASPMVEIRAAPGAELITHVLGGVASVLVRHVRPRGHAALEGFFL